MARKDIDMLHGDVIMPMIKFMLPLAFTSVMQQLFNTADVLVLGRFVGTTALAAVGNNSPVIGVLVSLFLGISLGANVIIARYIGAGDFYRITRGVHTAFFIAIVLGIILAIVGELLATDVLLALGVPSEVIPEAELYLRVYLLGIPAMSLYNFLSAIFRSRGDTATPLKALVWASLMNVVLNLVAVTVFSFGVAGVALATAVSNYLGAGILLLALIKTHGALRLVLSKVKPSAEQAKEILKIGVPAGVQLIVFSLSNIVIQAAINSLGANVMAASAAAFIIEINVYCFVIAFGQAATTFVSQNYGARQFARCREIIRKGLMLGVVVTIAMSAAVCYNAEFIMHFFADDPEIIKLGCVRVLYVVGFYVLYLTTDYLAGAIRGFGFSLGPAILMLLTICGTRVLWIIVMFPLDKTFVNIMYSYPVSWGVTTIFLIFLYRFYRRELWNKFGHF